MPKEPIGGSHQPSAHSVALSLGIQKARLKFLVLLVERRSKIEFNKNAAEQAQTALELAAVLDSLQLVLHQIAGTSSLLGFPVLGQSSKEAEAMIVAHKQRGFKGIAPWTHPMAVKIQEIVDQCEAVILDTAQEVNSS